MTGAVRWLLALLLVAPFAAPALLDGVYVGNGTDMYSYQLPMRRALRAMWLDGALPTWNPYVLGGVPCLAAMQLGVLYPPNWLTGWMPVELGVELSLLLHGAWLIFGGMRLSQVCRGRATWTPDAPSLVTAAVLATAGQLWGHVYAGHVSFWQAWSWTPWIWALALQLVGTRALRDVLWLSAALALQLLAGHPQVSYLSAWGLLALLVWRVCSSSDARTLRPWALLLSAAVVALALSAAQLWPTAALTPELNRSLADADSLPLAFSAPHQSLLTAVAPSAFGGTTARLVRFSYHESLAYVGAACLCLTICALIVVPRMWSLGLFMAFFVALSLGSSSPVMPSLIGVLPGLELFRVPPRWLLPVAGLMAVCCGQCVDVVSKPRVHRGTIASGVMLGLAGLALTLAVTVDAESGWWADTLSRPAKAATVASVAAQVRSHLWWCVLVACACAWLIRRETPAASLPWVLLAVLAVEGGLFVRPHLDRARHWPSARVDWSPGLASSLKQVSGQERLLTSARLRHANWGGGHQIAVAGGYETAAPLWSNIYLNHAAGRRSRRYAVNLQVRRGSPWLDRLATRHYLHSAREPGLKGWREVARSGDLILERNPNAMPRLHFADKTDTVADRAEVMARLARAPRDVTYLNQVLPHSPAARTQIHQVRWSPTHVEMSVETDRPAVLVLRDAWLPGWRSTIDHQPTKTAIADGLFRAVSVPSGRHQISMTYSAPGLWPGALTSALAWLVWCGLWWFIGRRRREAA